MPVQDLGGYTFDYVAYAVRKGFEDYEVYLTNEQAGELRGQVRRMSPAGALARPENGLD